MPRDKTGLLLKAADVLVWDDAPMSRRHLFEALDHSLRDLMRNDLAERYSSSGVISVKSFQLFTEDGSLTL